EYGGQAEVTFDLARAAEKSFPTLFCVAPPVADSQDHIPMVVAGVSNTVERSRQAVRQIEAQLAGEEIERQPVSERRPGDRSFGQAELGVKQALRLGQRTWHALDPLAGVGSPKESRRNLDTAVYAQRLTHQGEPLA